MFRLRKQAEVRIFILMIDRINGKVSLMLDVLQKARLISPTDLETSLYRLAW
jgi:hypothetical protein